MKTRHHVVLFSSGGKAGPKTPSSSATRRRELPGKAYGSRIRVLWPDLSVIQVSCNPRSEFVSTFVACQGQGEIRMSRPSRYDLILVVFAAEKLATAMNVPHRSQVTKAHPSSPKISLLDTPDLVYTVTSKPVPVPLPCPCQCQNSSESEHALAISNCSSVLQTNIRFPPSCFPISMTAASRRSSS